MILAYHLGTVSGDATFRRNQKLLNKIVNGEIVGVVTTFTIAECVAVLALAHAKRNGITPTPNQVQQALERVERFVRAAGIEEQNADALLQGPSGDANLFSRVTQVVLAAQPVVGRDGEWRNVGGADALHVVFAERSESDYLATFDEGFRGMQSTVSLLMVQEL